MRREPIVDGKRDGCRLHWVMGERGMRGVLVIKYGPLVKER